MWSKHQHIARIYLTACTLMSACTYKTLDGNNPYTENFVELAAISIPAIPSASLMPTGTECMRISWSAEQNGVLKMIQNSSYFELTNGIADCTIGIPLLTSADVKSSQGDLFLNLQIGYMMKPHRAVENNNVYYALFDSVKLAVGDRELMNLGPTGGNSPALNSWFFPISQQELASEGPLRFSFNGAASTNATSSICKNSSSCTAPSVFEVHKIALYRNVTP